VRALSSSNLIIFQNKRTYLREEMVLIDAFPTILKLSVKSM
jgi:hypothetical protein